jgi:hypothetical protein
MADLRAEQTRTRLRQTPVDAAREPRAKLDDLQAGMIRGTQKLRRKRLPAGRP